MMTDAPISELLDEGYRVFTEDFTDIGAGKREMDSLGSYYFIELEMEDGSRFNVWQGDFTEEDDDPIFRLVVERSDVGPRDNRYWRVAMDPDGNILVEGSDSGQTSDRSIIEMASEVLAEGTPIQN